jgi:4-alpha-glucanotransferase
MEIRKSRYHPKERRGSGILLHVTSLPSPYGIGDMGPQAYGFVDFLSEARQAYWQVLPLTATDYQYECSPYNCMSAFAGNKYLISPELMVKHGYLSRSELKTAPKFARRAAEFPVAAAYREYLFDKAYVRFTRRRQYAGYIRFCKDNRSWLDDYALFAVLKRSFHNAVWNQWPAPIARRDPYVLRSLRKLLKPAIEREKFIQYVFAQQWAELKKYCNRKKISVIGDIPIYVDFNSVDVWVHPEMFKLDKNGNPTHVAGVPPDYFSRDGQLWGNPLYCWPLMAKNKFRWWSDRIGHNLRRFDIVRMDHFRGFVAYWQVGAGSKTARRGTWVKVPAVKLFRKLKKRFDGLPIIAEDLGTITPDVRALMHRFGLPGMRVLLFAFGDGDSANPYLPHNHVEDCVVYTGTHDNNTVRGWFEQEASIREKKMVSAYVGKRITARNVHEVFVLMAMGSVANTVIIPMQDVLGLSAKARMNRPATIRGNWRWRLIPGQLSSTTAVRLGAMTAMYGRD